MASSSLMPPSMVPTHLVPGPHHLPCTFNVTGLSLPSDTTGHLGQRVEGQCWGLSGFVLSSRRASLQAHGIRATRRGSAAGRRGHPTSHSPGCGWGMCRQIRKSLHLQQRALPLIFASPLYPLTPGPKPSSRQTPGQHPLPTWKSVQNQSLGRHRAH